MSAPRCDARSRLGRSARHALERARCSGVVYRCALGAGWASSTTTAGRTLAEVLTCARPRCVRPVPVARDTTYPVLATLCGKCRTQYRAYRARGMPHAEALTLVMRPLQARRGHPGKERAA